MTCRPFSRGQSRSSAFAFNGRIGKTDGKGAHRVEQVGGHECDRQSEDGDAGIARWIETQRVAEVEIESDQTPAFGTTGFDEPVVSGRRQAFLHHRGDVVSRRPQDVRSAVAEVLVELDLQDDASRGTST